ncbi:MAG: DUF4177 domain-containing protein [Chthoniobacterales bacterium]
MKISLPVLRPIRLTLLTFIFSAAFFLTLPAQGAAPKWEYTVVNARLNNGNLENLLNSYAAKRWELVQITKEGVAIFKRTK